MGRGDVRYLGCCARGRGPHEALDRAVMGAAITLILTVSLGYLVGAATHRWPLWAALGASAVVCTAWLLVLRWMGL